MSMFLYIRTYRRKQLDAGKNFFLSESHLPVSLFFFSQKNLRSHLFAIVADQQI
jgi:hypothetical protein